MQPTPDIAILWRKSDGSTCVLTRRDTTLFLSVQRDGQVVMEKVVESPTEAMELAKAWKALPSNLMKVRILKQPSGTMNGISLTHYHPESVYDLPANLADYLVLEGFAAYEMRNDDASRPPEIDRRKKNR